MPSYYPGTRYGGPVRSLSMLVSALKPKFRFCIITPNVDFGLRTPYLHITPNKWIAVDGAFVSYLDRRGRMIHRLWSTIVDQAPDLIYLNSALHPGMSLMPLVARRVRDPRGHIPVLIAPRGELLSGALAIRPNKKQAFLKVARAVGLWNHCAWHATSQHEAEAIQEHTGVPHSQIFVAPPITGIATSIADTPSRDSVNSELRVLFASRVSRMKNLEFCLRVLAKAERKVHLTIAGPHEDPSYWKECDKLISFLPAQVRVDVRGELSREQLAVAYSTHDLLFLPTRGESFGHVIAEALLAGLPALISDRTYFRELSLASAGWDLPLEQTQSWISAIQSLADLPASSRMKYRHGAQIYAQRVLNPTTATRSMATLFDAVIARANDPLIVA